jgi:hypothetical protein
MNITRTVFGRHRAGHLFPMLLCVKPMSNSFAGVIQKLYTPDQFLLFTSLSRRIAGGTQDTMRLLGDVELEDVVVPLAQYISDDDMALLLKGTEEVNSKLTQREMRSVEISFNNCSDDYLLSLGRPMARIKAGDRSVRVMATLQITGFLATGWKSERLEGESFKCVGCAPRGFCEPMCLCAVFVR